MVQDNADQIGALPSEGLQDIVVVEEIARAHSLDKFPCIIPLLVRQVKQGLVRSV